MEEQVQDIKDLLDYLEECVRCCLIGIVNEEPIAVAFNLGLMANALRSTNQKYYPDEEDEEE